VDGREILDVFGPERGGGLVGIGGGALIAAAAGNSDQQGQHADD
jgi:hypothetical protein